MRLLDAFRPRGATWSGQVISSPPGPSGGPSKTHLLPGGGVFGFTELGAPSLPGFPISPLPGQSIDSQPWLRALTHCVAPLMLVAPGTGAAGPVLLACRQWDPLGLARRLPSLGAGAWRSAPLLPWRVQCPVRVCAALAAGSGRSGRYLVLCLSRFPLPPRVSRAACGGLSRPGVPYPRSLVRHSMQLCVPRARSGCPSDSPRVPFACVFLRSRSRGVRSPPPGWCGVRTSRGPGTGRW